MSKVPISVCIIAKNEERYIEGCLQRLKPFGFEIIVTDTGSTDRTKEIAEKYADKVVDFEWIDDFAAARNFCAKHATNNWILALDCDEYMESFDAAGVRILMQKFVKAQGRLQLKNLVNSDGINRYTVDDVIRFYNKKRFVWANSIHEQLVYIDEPENTQYACFDMPIEVIHHGYNITPEEMEKKQLRNLRLLEKHIETHPDDCYSWFQIGQSRFILGLYNEAVEAYEKALSMETNLKRSYVEVMIESLGKTYINLDRTQDAVNLMLKYESEFKTARYLAVLSDAYLENNEILKALISYIKTLSMEDRDTLGDGLLNCCGRIIDIYKNMGQDDMAEMYMDLYEKYKQEKERVINA